jgi:hypothetical protein
MMQETDGNGIITITGNSGFASKWYKERGGKWKTVSESEITEDLRDWFDEKWVDISRKKDGKHPECGDSAGKGQRKKDSSKAYPRCVPKSKAASMSKKDKESSSRRKRSAQSKAGDKQTFVSVKKEK